MSKPLCLFLAAALATLASCGKASTYPPGYRTAFIASCEANRVSEEVCACVWARVEAEIPQAQFEALDRAVQLGQSHPLAARITEFHAACSAGS